jgi:prepilin-type N-terminal cleavage/methylation domain-containing protein
MNRSSTVSRRRTARGGFTLVELLTVIVIIGVLVSLITAAAIRARSTARNAVVSNEVGGLNDALEAYKIKYGQLPPCDFSNQARVMSHLRVRFPNYRPANFAAFASDVQSATGLNPGGLTPASALVFWLGGIPDGGPSMLPAGFSADQSNPFRAGKPRIAPQFDFVQERLRDADGNGWRAYYPEGITAAPFVYFRSWNGDYSGLSYTPSNGNAGTAVPYRSGDNSMWRNERGCQIVTAGLDGIYGTGTGPRCSQTGTNCSPEDYDNHTNFTQGRIQDEM